MKTRMTKERKAMIDKIKKLNSENVALCFGYTERGAEEYYFSNGGNVNQEIVSRMINAGILKKSDSILGMGQELELVGD